MEEAHLSDRDRPESGFFSRAETIPKKSASAIENILPLLRLVREDLKAHRGEWTRPGFQALLVYRFGVWRTSIHSKLWRAPFTLSSRALFTVVRNFYGIELPFGARIGRRVVFEHQGGIVVHGKAVIGDDCIIRQGVTLGIRRIDSPTEAPILGRGVNVGAGAKILGHVYVGDHAEIGANAVVLEDVPAATLAVGVPARLVPRAHRTSDDLNAVPAGDAPPSSRTGRKLVSMGAAADRKIAERTR
jgi:serine O-acetyltransferase